MNRRVVITGMGVKTPFCDSIEEFSNIAIKNTNVFKEIKRFDANNFISNLSCSFPPESDDDLLSKHFNKEFLEANYLRRRASEYFAGFILT